MALNPFQQAVSDLARSMGLRGQAEQQVYSTPQYQDLIAQMLGNIPLPAGVQESQVISRSPTLVEYKDAQGFVHRLERGMDARDQARFGQVSETSTNRPAIIPAEQDTGALGQTLGQFFGLPVGPNDNPNLNNNQAQNPLQQLSQALSNPVQLQGLDQNTLALLKTMADAENASNQQAFDRQRGTAVAQLVGRGVGASSIAGDIMNQLLQGQGLVNQQTQAGQAQRQLSLQQYLTGAQQNQNQNLQQFISTLLGLGTQRDISGDQLNIQQQQINNQNQQYYDQLFQQQLQIEEQQRQAERQAMWNNIFKGIAAGTGIASGLGGLNLGSLFGGGGFNYGAAGKPPSPYGYG